MRNLNVAGYFAACVISMAVATPIFTKLADRSTSRKMVMVPGMLGSALMSATQPYCDTPTQFLCVGLVGALANALVMPNVAAFIMDNSAQEDRAQALALRCVSCISLRLVGWHFVHCLLTSLGPNMGVHCLQADGARRRDARWSKFNGCVRSLCSAARGVSRHCQGCKYPGCHFWCSVHKRACHLSSVA